MMETGNDAIDEEGTKEDRPLTSTELIWCDTKIVEDRIFKIIMEVKPPYIDTRYGWINIPSVLNEEKSWYFPPPEHVVLTPEMTATICHWGRIT